MDFKGRFLEKTKTNILEKEKAENSNVKPQLAMQQDADQVSDAEMLKLIKKPHSKKYVKAIKILDVLTENDERIISEMKKDAGLSEDADVTFTEDDMEAFRKKVKGIVQEEIEKEKNIVKEVFTGCYISGCEVHSIGNNSSTIILAHYTADQIDAMDKMRRFAARLVMKNGKASTAEVYPSRVVLRNSAGDVAKIYNESEIE